MKPKLLIAIIAAILFTANASSQATDWYTPAGFTLDGASKHHFSVSATKKVRFSRGNLQYNAAQDTWRFALRQYSYACQDNANISSSYDGWIDLFGFGTSGWNSGATAYQPWDTSRTSSDYLNHDLTGDYANADWGVYNRISNGGNTAGRWRTLSEEEWRYLTFGRNDALNKRGCATIANLYKGLVILPDDWTLPAGVSFTPNSAFASNKYSYEQWGKMEASGAIFLPAASERIGVNVTNSGNFSYWSSTVSTYMWGANAYLSVTYTSTNYEGNAVRLVQDYVEASASASLSETRGEWIDLGLPSGLLWYSVNIGATAPEEYGCYFAWGETKTKNDYSWTTYSYSNNDGTTLIKYNYDESYGRVDSLTTLMPNDDVATVVLGSGARMPTEEEWQELLDNSSDEWTTMNGVYGTKFTSNVNGSSLFLPAAGYRNGTALYSEGEEGYGYYWTSSLHMDGATGGSSINLSSYGPSIGGGSNRRAGYTVRAVRSAQ